MQIEATGLPVDTTAQLFHSLPSCIQLLYYILTVFWFPCPDTIKPCVTSGVRLSLMIDCMMCWDLFPPDSCCKEWRSEYRNHCQVRGDKTVTTEWWENESRRCWKMIFKHFEIWCICPSCESKRSKQDMITESLLWPETNTRSLHLFLFSIFTANLSDKCLITLSVISV